jgi:hypothetical protein
VLGNSRRLAVAAVTGVFAATSLAVASLVSVPSDAGSGIDRTVRVLVGSDAVVRSSSPTVPHESGRRLPAWNENGVRKVSYLKFSVRPAALEGGRIVGAKVLLSSRADITAPVQLRWVADTGWNASTLTYKNAPARGAIVGEVGPGTAATRWVDVSSRVQGPGTYAFALSAESGSTFFASRETRSGPELVLRIKNGEDTSPSEEPRKETSPTPQPSSSTTQSAPRSGDCKETFPGDPCPGEMYYGASVEGGNPTTLESNAGAKLSLHRTYMQASTPVSAFVSRAKSDIAAGRLPLMSTKVPASWASVAAGNQDAWLGERIKALAQVGGPVWLVLHHEPRGDGNPADWVRMQQHARTLIDRYSDNIALVGILNGWDFLERDGNPQVFRHPVGTGVHIMGFDSYNPYTPTNGDAWKSVEKTMSPGITIQGWGYPTLVGETGVHAVAGDGGRAAEWIRDQFAYGVSRGFVGISYFDSSYNSKDGGWRLTGDRLDAFARNLRSGAVARIR